MKADGEVTRILLATDGDFNVGISDPEELKAFIAREARERGLSCRCWASGGAIWTTR